MKHFLCFLMLLPTFSFAQTGVLSGNAYWKYNDYVGNKADAGSEVYLYYDSITAPIKTECDLQGNFKIDNLKSGTYLLLIKSKNTVDDWRGNFISVRFTRWGHFTKFNEGFINKSLFDSVDAYTGYYNDELTQKVGAFSYNKHEKKIEKQRKEIINCIKRALANVPKTDDMYFLWGIPLDYPSKLFVKEVIILPNQTTTTVADFGTTYI
jgi:hypothetical protein